MMYGKKKMYQSGGKVDKKEVTDPMKALERASRVQKMEGEANKKLKEVSEDKKKSLGKIPESVRNKMGYKKKGGKVKEGYHKMPDGKIMKDSAHKKMAHGGKVGSECGRPTGKGFGAARKRKGGGSVMKYGKSGY